MLLNDVKDWGGKVRFRVSIDDNWGFDEVETPTEGTIDPGAWNTIIASYDAENSLLILHLFDAGTDGKWTAPTSEAVVRPTIPFSVGTAISPTSSTSTEGIIDEVGFWNRVLSDQEAAEVATALSYEDL